MTKAWLIRRLSLVGLVFFGLPVIREIPLFSFLTFPTRHGYWWPISYEQLALGRFDDLTWTLLPSGFSKLVIPAGLLGLGALICVTAGVGMVRPSARWIYPMSVATLGWFAISASTSIVLLGRLLSSSWGIKVFLDAEMGGYMVALSVALTLIAGLVSRLEVSGREGL
jgi:hypothetical protein